jgi:hypothetical protein
MRALLLIVATTGLANCIDFKDGLVCAADRDCLDYVCLQGFCRAPKDSVSTLASEQPGASNLNVDDSGVYWQTYSKYRLSMNRIPKTGGSPTATTIRDNTIYLYMNMTWDTSAAYAIMRDKIILVPRSGAAATVLVTVEQVRTQLSSISAFNDAITNDPSNVYWYGIESGGSTGKILKISKTDGLITALATAETPDSLVVAQGNVFWSTAHGIRAVSTSGGTPSTITSGNRVEQLWTDGSTLYGIWDRESFMAAAIGRSEATTIDVDFEIRRFATDGKDLFWSGRSRPDIYRMAVNGGTIITWVPVGYESIYYMAVDDRYVYWIQGGSMIMRAPK